MALENVGNRLKRISLELDSHAEQAEKIKQKVEGIQFDTAFLKLEFVCLELKRACRVEVHVERLSGKTHLLHVYGHDRNIEHFKMNLQHTHRATEMEANYIFIPYVGWRGKKKFKEMLARPPISRHTERTEQDV